MSKPRTTRRPTSATTSRARRTTKKVSAKSIKVRCAMPACESPRIAGKAFCSAHARQARERLRVAAGDAAWA